MSTHRGDLYLLPALLGNSPADAVLPTATLDAARRIDYVLAESARSARALLKAIGHPKPIAQLRIVEIGHQPDPAQLDGWLEPLVRDGVDAAIVSEAGCPGVADPGATIIARAHELGIVVRPLVGPSSILLALMASGMNGQQFRFVGYLPREAAPLAKRLRELERDSLGGETQIFMETPYRNERLLAAIFAACAPTTRLSIAVDLTTATEHVATRSIQDWMRLGSNRVSLDDRPAVFCLQAAPAYPGRQPGARAKESGRQ
ncbi:MAG: SAM-dependent methyltransferase [Gemmatimonadota bacterium]